MSCGKFSVDAWPKKAVKLVFLIIIKKSFQPFSPACAEILQNVNFLLVALLNERNLARILWLLEFSRKIFSLPSTLIFAVINHKNALLTPTSLLSMLIFFSYIFPLLWYNKAQINFFYILPYVYEFTLHITIVNSAKAWCDEMKSRRWLWWIRKKHTIDEWIYCLSVYSWLWGLCWKVIFVLIAK